MTSYAGLDVSQQATQVCVVDARGAVLWTGKVRSEPTALAAVLRRRAPGLARVVLESGALQWGVGSPQPHMSGWLCCGLVEAGLPAVCIDARAAHGALKQRRSKTDAGDAEGLARLAQVGWFKIVRVKSQRSQEQRALLVARERLVRVQRDLMNQVRGLLKAAGLVLPRTTPGRLAVRTHELLDDAPGLRPAIAPLLAARAGVALELDRLDTAIVRLAGADPICRRLVTIPGVGPITALTFKTVIDDPARFTRADQTAAYLGLTPRRWQSGEVDHQGRISPLGPRGPQTPLGAGNSMARHLLYEAANSLLARVKRPCALKHWAQQLKERVGGRKARVASWGCGDPTTPQGARQLAVLMHRLWTRGTDFDWQRGMGVA
jgi:transposase